MSFPTVVGALWGLQDGITFRLVQKQVVDFEVVETEGAGGGFGGGGFGGGGFGGASGAVEGIFTGVLEPLKPYRLQVKPEGQRRWKWWRLWTTMKLSHDDIIVDANGKRYRVMPDLYDWSGGGYYEYEVAETFDQVPA